MLADFHLHQAFGQQQVEAVFAQQQFAQQLMRDPVRMLGQCRQGFTLARCAGDARVVKTCAGHRRPEALLARFGRFALAQQHGQRPAQCVTQAVLIILGGPQAQLEQRGGQWRCGVEDRHRWLEFLRRDFAVIGDFHQDADHFPAPKRHPHAHARLQLRPQYAGRSPVVEQAAQGRGQG